MRLHTLETICKIKNPKLQFFWASRNRKPALAKIVSFEDCVIMHEILRQEVPQFWWSLAQSLDNFEWYHYGNTIWQLDTGMDNGCRIENNNVRHSRKKWKKHVEAVKVATDKKNIFSRTIPVLTCFSRILFDKSIYFSRWK